MSRILMVSPFPPYRDGIATYAAQEVARLRSAGNEVAVCSPVPSAARYHHGVGGPKGLGRLLVLARSFDRVIVQFYPELLTSGCRTALQRAGQWGLLAVLGRRTDLELRIHEIDYAALDVNPIERRAAAAAIRSARTVSLHTASERDRLVEALGLDPSGLTLVDHGQSFTLRYRGDQQSARAELGLDPTRHVFVSIGFLQAHKGFDRSIEAFRQLPPGLASLHVVGSARIDHPDVVSHVGRLRRLAAATPGAELHEGFVGDVEFDRWLVAADTIVLPYREIWSSGVIERAKLVPRTVIATRVGGLADQVGEGGAIFVDDDEALVAALLQEIDPQAALDESSRDVAASTWRVDHDHPDQGAIQRQVRERASSPAAPTATDEPPWMPLAELGDPLVRPTATSARPGIAPIKRVVQALSWWQVHPVVERLNRLEQATLESVRRLDRQRPGDR